MQTDPVVFDYMEARPKSAKLKRTITYRIRIQRLLDYLHHQDKYVLRPLRGAEGFSELRNRIKDYLDPKYEILYAIELDKLLELVTLSKPLRTDQKNLLDTLTKRYSKLQLTTEEILETEIENITNVIEYKTFIYCSKIFQIILFPFHIWKVLNLTEYFFSYLQLTRILIIYLHIVWFNQTTTLTLISSLVIGHIAVAKFHGQGPVILDTLRENNYFLSRSKSVVRWPTAFYLNQKAHYSPCYWKEAFLSDNELRLEMHPAWRDLETQTFKGTFPLKKNLQLGENCSQDTNVSAISGLENHFNFSTIISRDVPYLLPGFVDMLMRDLVNKETQLTSKSTKWLKNKYRQDLTYRVREAYAEKDRLPYVFDYFPSQLESVHWDLRQAHPESIQNVEEVIAHLLKDEPSNRLLEIQDRQELQKQILFYNAIKKLNPVRDHILGYDIHTNSTKLLNRWKRLSQNDDMMQIPGFFNTNLDLSKTDRLSLLTPSSLLEVKPQPPIDVETFDFFLYKKPNDYRPLLNDALVKHPTNIDPYTIFRMKKELAFNLQSKSKISSKNGILRSQTKTLSSKTRNLTSSATDLIISERDLFKKGLNAFYVKKRMAPWSIHTDATQNFERIEKTFPDLFEPDEAKLYQKTNLKFKDLVNHFDNHFDRENSPIVKESTTPDFLKQATLIPHNEEFERKEIKSRIAQFEDFMLFKHLYKNDPILELKVSPRHRKTIIDRYLKILNYHYDLNLTQIKTNPFRPDTVESTQIDTQVLTISKIINNLKNIAVFNSNGKKVGYLTDVLNPALLEDFLSKSAIRVKNKKFDQISDSPYTFTSTKTEKWFREKYKRGLRRQHKHLLRYRSKEYDGLPDVVELDDDEALSEAVEDTAPSDFFRQVFQMNEPNPILKRDKQLAKKLTQVKKRGKKRNNQLTIKLKQAKKEGTNKKLIQQLINDKKEGKKKTKQLIQKLIRADKLARKSDKLKFYHQLRRRPKWLVEFINLTEYQGLKFALREFDHKLLPMPLTSREEKSRLIKRIKTRLMLIQNQLLKCASQEEVQHLRLLKIQLGRKLHNLKKASFNPLKQTPATLEFTRQMSGYRYPDMTHDDMKSFVHRNAIEQTIKPLMSKFGLTNSCRQIQMFLPPFWLRPLDPVSLFECDPPPQHKKVGYHDFYTRSQRDASIAHLYQYFKAYSIANPFVPAKARLSLVDQNYIPAPNESTPLKSDALSNKQINDKKKSGDRSFKVAWKIFHRHYLERPVIDLFKRLPLQKRTEENFFNFYKQLFIQRETLKEMKIAKKESLFQNWVDLNEPQFKDEHFSFVKDSSLIYQSKIWDKLFTSSRYLFIQVPAAQRLLPKSTQFLKDDLNALFFINQMKTSKNWPKGNKTKFYFDFTNLINSKKDISKTLKKSNAIKPFARNQRKRYYLLNILTPKIRASVTHARQLAIQRKVLALQKLQNWLGRTQLDTTQIPVSIDFDFLEALYQVPSHSENLINTFSSKSQISLMKRLSQPPNFKENDALQTERRMHLFKLRKMGIQTKRMRKRTKGPGFIRKWIRIELKYTRKLEKMIAKYLKKIGKDKEKVMKPKFKKLMKSEEENPRFPILANLEGKSKVQEETQAQLAFHSDKTKKKQRKGQIGKAGDTTEYNDELDDEPKPKEKGKRLLRRIEAFKKKHRDILKLEGQKKKLLLHWQHNNLNLNTLPTGRNIDMICLHRCLEKLYGRYEKRQEGRKFKFKPKSLFRSRKKTALHRKLSKIPNDHITKRTLINTALKTRFIDDLQLSGLTNDQDNTAIIRSLHNPEKRLLAKISKTLKNIDRKTFYYWLSCDYPFKEGTNSGQHFFGYKSEMSRLQALLHKKRWARTIPKTQLEFTPKPSFLLGTPSFAKIEVDVQSDQGLIKKGVWAPSNEWNKLLLAYDRSQEETLEDQKIADRKLDKPKEDTLFYHAKLSGLRERAVKDLYDRYEKEMRQESAKRLQRAKYLISKATEEARAGFLNKLSPKAKNERITVKFDSISKRPRFYKNVFYKNDIVWTTSCLYKLLFTPYQTDSIFRTKPQLAFVPDTVSGHQIRLYKKTLKFYKKYDALTRRYLRRLYRREERFKKRVKRAYRREMRRCRQTKASHLYELYHLPKDVIQHLSELLSSTPSEERTYYRKRLYTYVKTQLRQKRKPKEISRIPINTKKLTKNKPFIPPLFKRKRRVKQNQNQKLNRKLRFVYNREFNKDNPLKVINFVKYGFTPYQIPMVAHARYNQLGYELVIREDPNWRDYSSIFEDLSFQVNPWLQKVGPASLLESIGTKPKGPAGAQFLEFEGGLTMLNPSFLKKKHTKILSTLEDLSYHPFIKFVLNLIKSKNPHYIKNSPICDVRSQAVIAQCREYTCLFSENASFYKEQKKLKTQGAKEFVEDDVELSMDLPPFYADIILRHLKRPRLRFETPALQFSIEKTADISRFDNKYRLLKSETNDAKITVFAYTQWYMQLGYLSLIWFFYRFIVEFVLPPSLDTINYLVNHAGTAYALKTYLDIHQLFNTCLSLFLGIFFIPHRYTILKEYKVADIKNRQKVNKFRLSRDRSLESFIPVDLRESVPIDYSQTTLYSRRITDIHEKELIRSQEYLVNIPLEKLPNYSTGLYLNRQLKLYSKYYQFFSDPVSRLEFKLRQNNVLGSWTPLGGYKWGDTSLEVLFYRIVPRYLMKLTSKWALELPDYLKPDPSRAELNKERRLRAEKKPTFDIDIPDRGKRDQNYFWFGASGSNARLDFLLNQKIKYFHNQELAFKQIPKGVMILGNHSTGRKLFVKNLALMTKLTVFHQKMSDLKDAPDRHEDFRPNFTEVLQDTQKAAPVLLILENVHQACYHRPYKLLIQAWKPIALKESFKEGFITRRESLSRKTKVSGEYDMEDHMLTKIQTLERFKHHSNYNSWVQNQKTSPLNLRYVYPKKFLEMDDLRFPFESVDFEWALWKIVLDDIERNFAKKMRFKILLEFLFTIDKYIIPRTGAMMFGITHLPHTIDSAVTRRQRFSKFIFIPQTILRKQSELFSVFGKHSKLPFNVGVSPQYLSELAGPITPPYIAQAVSISAYFAQYNHFISKWNNQIYKPLQVEQNIATIEFGIKKANETETRQTRALKHALSRRRFAILNYLDQCTYGLFSTHWNNVSKLNSGAAFYSCSHQTNYQASFMLAQPIYQPQTETFGSKLKRINKKFFKIVHPSDSPSTILKLQLKSMKLERKVLNDPNNPWMISESRAFYVKKNNENERMGRNPVWITEEAKLMIKQINNPKFLPFWIDQLSTLLDLIETRVREGKPRIKRRPISLLSAVFNNLHRLSTLFVVPSEQVYDMWTRQKETRYWQNKVTKKSLSDTFDFHELRRLGIRYEYAFFATDYHNKKRTRKGEKSRLEKTQIRIVHDVARYFQDLKETKYFNRYIDPPKNMSLAIELIDVNQFKLLRKLVFSNLLLLVVNSSTEMSNVLREQKSLFYFKWIQKNQLVLNKYDCLKLHKKWKLFSGRANSLNKWFKERSRKPNLRKPVQEFLNNERFFENEISVLHRFACSQAGLAILECFCFKTQPTKCLKLQPEPKRLLSLEDIYLKRYTRLEHEIWIVTQLAGRAGIALARVSELSQQSDYTISNVTRTAYFMIMHSGFKSGQPQTQALKRSAFWTRENSNFDQWTGRGDVFDKEHPVDNYWEVQYQVDKMRKRIYTPFIDIEDQNRLTQLKIQVFGLNFRPHKWMYEQALYSGELPLKKVGFWWRLYFHKPHMYDKQLLYVQKTWRYLDHLYVDQNLQAPDFRLSQAKYHTLKYLPALRSRPSNVARDWMFEDFRTQVHDYMTSKDLFDSKFDSKSDLKSTQASTNSKTDKLKQTNSVIQNTPSHIDYSYLIDMKNTDEIMALINLLFNQAFGVLAANRELLDHLTFILMTEDEVSEDMLLTLRASFY